jgi:hypothetical protein
MHYVNRGHMATRYDEINCHGGCAECNVFDTDHVRKYYLAMVKTYGPAVVAVLENKANGLQKFMRWEIEDKINFYKSELRLKTV